MKNILIALFTLAALSTWSCKKDKLDNIDQINFGHSNFSWGPDCAFYLLSPAKLYTSSRVCDPRDTSAIIYDIQLSAEKFELAKRLLVDLPEDIFTTAETDFTTNCADCGGYYLQIRKGDSVKTVNFSDVLNNDWPDYARRTHELLSSIIYDL